MFCIFADKSFVVTYIFIFNMKKLFFLLAIYCAGACAHKPNREYWQVRGFNKTFDDISIL